MPSLPDVPSVCRITVIQQSDDGGSIINRFYQEYSGAPNSLSSTGALSWAAAAATGWASHMQSITSPAVRLLGIRVEDLSSATGAVGQSTNNVVGTNSGHDLGAGTALVIREVITRRYRGGHPRQYLPGLLAEALTDSGNWDTTFLANFVTAYTAFRAAVAAGVPGGIAPANDCSVSFYHGFHNVTLPSGRVRSVPTLRTTPVVDAVASFNGNPKVASQRRRNQQSS